LGSNPGSAQTCCVTWPVSTLPPATMFLTAGERARLLQSPAFSQPPFVHRVHCQLCGHPRCSPSVCSHPHSQMPYPPFRSQHPITGPEVRDSEGLCDISLAHYSSSPLALKTILVAQIWLRE
jgi:hypothetical protein